MQQYPNYFPMNNFYPQQMQQQAYNPYMQRMDHLQAMQQQIQTNNQFATLGKMVESVDMVKTMDIPMDGNLYYFPKADGSEIYAKQWLANGTTQILTFRPVLNVQEENKVQAMPEQDGLIDVLMKRFDELSDKFDKLEKNIRPTVKKKEVPDE